MVDVWNEYEEKINDIELYFSYLKENENDIPSNIVKIQKANVFLMLYNLLESTVNDALEEIHNILMDERIRYKDSIDEIQKLWRRFKKNNYNEEDIVYMEYKKVRNKKLLSVSGNIDARKIREILRYYNVDENSRVIGKRLKNVKDIRNNLAHDDISFSKLGRNYTISDIGKFCQECKLFLREFLQNVEKYIRDRKYNRI